jgi:hypothetical protein
MFATLIDGLLLSDNVPWYPIFVGLAIGLLALAMDVGGQKKGIQLPCMALAVGIYLPPVLGIGILIGAAARWYAERGRGQSGESILAAAGMITGAALLELLLGSLIVVAASTPVAGTLSEDELPAGFPVAASEEQPTHPWFVESDLRLGDEWVPGLSVRQQREARSDQGLPETPDGELEDGQLPWQQGFGLLGIAALAGLLWLNSRRPRASGGVA